MSAAAQLSASWPAIHRQFEAVLPQIRRTIRFQFRDWPRRGRAEAIADACAASWHAWHGLVRRGHDPLAVGPTGIAFNACRYVKGGRRLGTGPCGRGGADIYHRKARRLGLRIVSLDRATDRDHGGSAAGWRDWLAADHRVSPADEAAFRIDFAAWLAGLPGRKRRVAELLAAGHGTGEVARLLGVTPAAISQARAALARSWHEFQGEDVA